MLDEGYIGAGLFKALYKKGLKLITGIRKNMKNYLIDLTDKRLLRKIFCIETIFGFLKNSMNLEHTRHRSSINFLINLIAALTAYSLTKGKTKNYLSPHLLSIVELIIAPIFFHSYCDVNTFKTYVEHILIKSLKSVQIVVMDNVFFIKVNRLNY